MLTIYSPTQLLAWARALYGDQRLYLTEYTYNADFGDILTAQNLTRAVQISAQADFVMLGASLFSDVAGSGGAAEPTNMTVFMTDSSSGQPFMSNPTLVGNYLAGSFGNENRQLPFPRLLQGNSAVAVTLQNNSAVTYAKCKVTLQGFQIRTLV